jgi:poly(A) polymerase
MFKDHRIIEVSTFRKKGEETDPANDGDSLLIKRDNTFGSPAEDAFRRDFTVNALYYNIADFTIIDYVGGKADLQAGIIRTVGEPDIRFQEDPIRILRGIRLAATLEFHIEEQTWRAMQCQRHHINECALSRIREEMMKVVRRHGTFRAFELFVQAGVLESLLQGLDEFLRCGPRRQDFSVAHFWRYLKAVDEVRARGTELSDPVLVAALTTAPVMGTMKRLPPGQDVGKWLHEYLRELLSPIALSAGLRAQVCLLLLAVRTMLALGRNKRRRSLRNSPVFGDALKLLHVHCRATDRDWSVLRHWQQGRHRPRRSVAKPHTSEIERLP